MADYSEDGYLYRADAAVPDDEDSDRYCEECDREYCPHGVCLACDFCDKCGPEDNTDA